MNLTFTSSTSRASCSSLLNEQAQQTMEKNENRTQNRNMKNSNREQQKPNNWFRFFGVSVMNKHIDDDIFSWAGYTYIMQETACVDNHVDMTILSNIANDVNSELTRRASDWSDRVCRFYLAQLFSDTRQTVRLFRHQNNQSNSIFFFVQRFVWNLTLFYWVVAHVIARSR